VWQAGESGKRAVRAGVRGRQESYADKRVYYTTPAPMFDAAALCCFCHTHDFDYFDKRHYYGAGLLMLLRHVMMLYATLPPTEPCYAASLLSV